MQTLKNELLQHLHRSDLLRATLILGKIADVHFREGPYLESVMEMAAQVWFRTNVRQDMILKAQSINHVIFEASGIQGKSENYKRVFDNPSRFYLHELLNQKMGSPLIITILYVILADQVGLPCTCFSLPTQYVLKVDDVTGPFYVCPFDRGKFLTQEEFQRKLRRCMARNTMLSTNLYEQVGHSQLVSRLVQRLKHIYVLKGKAFEALRAVEFLTALFPESPELKRDRGILYCEVEYFSKAMQDLKRYLKQCPNAEDVREIKKLTAMLKGHHEIIN